MGRYVAGHLRGFIMGAVFAALALGFAYSMPAGFNISGHEPGDALVTPTEEPTPEVTATPEPTPEATATPEPTPAEEPDDPEGERPDNHGAAVSAAAHCPVKGKAHGALVSSIAKDKGATVADAEQACADAVAAQDLAGSQEVEKPGKASGTPSGKASAPGQAKKASGAAGGEPVEEPVEDELSGTPAKDKGNGKGKAKAK